MPKALTYAQWSLEPYAIGMKLRALRTHKRMTLSRLAAETGLSTALLSKLETDRMIPTLPTLATICRVYGVGLSHFFSEPDQHVISITRKSHLQGAARPVESLKAIPLNAPRSPSGLVAEMIEVPPSASEALASAYRRESCGLVYVLEGRLQLDAGGLHEVLESGDCAFFETRMPLTWSAGGKHPCRVITVRPGNPAKE